MTGAEVEKYYRDGLSARLRTTARAMCSTPTGYGSIKDVQTSTSRQEHRNEREAHQSTAPAYDRRHERAQFRREDAQRLYPARLHFHSLPWALARHSRA